MAEKVLARASGRERVAAGDYVTARADKVMAHEAFVLCALKLLQLGVEHVFDPSRVIVILDHYFLAPTERMAQAHTAACELVERFGIRHFLGHAGICHQVLPERGLVRPSELILGTDSHNTTYGALGAAGNGVGITEATWVLATGELWLRVPPRSASSSRERCRPASCRRTWCCISPGASEPRSPSTARSSTADPWPGRSRWRAA
jgi:3-isopropylmalate/(R)-2-methylmalate dehydratase large subunit